MTRNTGENDFMPTVFDIQNTSNILLESINEKILSFKEKNQQKTGRELNCALNSFIIDIANIVGTYKDANKKKGHDDVKIMLNRTDDCATFMVICLREDMETNFC